MFNKFIFLGILLIFAADLLINVVTNPNNFLFERFECDEPNPKFLSELKCEMKTIARNVLKINVTLAFTSEAQNNLWLRTTVYYCLNTYGKFFDLTENVCGYFNGGNKAPIFKLIIDNLLALKTEFNFKLQCPLPKTLEITNAAMNLSQFLLPIIPAGRYRFEFTFTKGKNGPTLLFAQLYVSVSDVRAFQWR